MNSCKFCSPFCSPWDLSENLCSHACHVRRKRQKIIVHISACAHHARFIPRWKYRFSSDQRSQATLGPVSTDVGDQSGTQGDLAFLHPFFSIWKLLAGARGPVILQAMPHLNSRRIVLPRQVRQPDGRCSIQTFGHNLKSGCR